MKHDSTSGQATRLSSLYFLPRYLILMAKFDPLRQNKSTTWAVKFHVKTVNASLGSVVIASIYQEELMLRAVQALPTDLIIQTCSLDVSLLNLLVT